MLEHLKKRSMDTFNNYQSLLKEHRQQNIKMEE